MLKPEGYDTAEEKNIGEFETLAPGGYICRIKKVQIATSKNGNEMLVLKLDIAEGDKSDYFRRRFDADTRENKKWPCVYRQLTEGNSIGYFKGMISAIEKSNQGYIFNFDESTLENKYIGVIFGEEEYLNFNNEIKTTVKPKWVRSIDVIRSQNFKIPEKKTVSLPVGAGTIPPGFTQLSEVVDDDDLPF